MSEKLVQKIFNEIRDILGNDLLESTYLSQGCIISDTEHLIIIFDKPTLDEKIPELEKQIKDSMLFISYPKEIKQLQETGEDTEVEIKIQNIIVKDKEELLETLAEVRDNLPDETLIRND